MRKIFDVNNAVWQFIGKLFDCLVLHVVWLVCSLPLITFGASTAALYYALMKDILDEDPHYVRAFFRSFRQNFRQGIGLGLGFLAFGAILGFAVYYYWQAGGPIVAVLRTFAIVIAVLYVMIGQYLFAVFARFDQKNSNLIRMAFVFSIRHFGKSLVMLLVFIGVYGIIFVLGFPPLLIMGFGLVVYLDCYVLIPVFEPYLQKIREAQDHGKDPDLWTVPEEEQP